MGNFPLRGPDQDTWARENSTDLLAVQRRSSRDPFSHWVSSSFIPYLHRKFLHRFKKPVPEDPESEICQYEDGKVALVMNVLSTVVASMLPISSIIILYFVQNTLDRLAIAVAFTGLFALCLVLTTRARRVEIFAATSTQVPAIFSLGCFPWKEQDADCHSRFAAVQVVFITGNNVYIS